MSVSGMGEHESALGEVPVPWRGRVPVIVLVFASKAVAFYSCLADRYFENGIQSG